MNSKTVTINCVDSSYDYKALSKYLSLSLGKVLENIVHLDQTCSIRGRSIFDNLHLLRNTYNYCEQKQIKCAFVSLDMQKAFDRVEYDFLFHCLEAYGFGENVVQWIRVLYTNISSSVITNGHISFPFPVTRGVRQGCSLSPLLYVLCLEPLLIRIRNHSNISGLHLPGTTESAVTSGYADDVTGIVTTEESVGNLLDTCTEYGLASGSKLNMGKSKGLWIGAWSDRDDQLFGIVWGKKIKICGVWFGVGYSPGQFWMSLVIKLDKNLNLWRTRNLSLTGRANVVNVCGLSKLWYVASSIAMPPAYIKMFNKLIFKYFWNLKMVEPVARNTVYQSKLQGGFNIVDIASKVSAFHLQHVQKLISSHNAKWTYFAIYWIGMTLRHHNPSFASNLIPHCLDYVPPFYAKVKASYLAFMAAKPDFIFGTVSTKTFYWHILDPKLKVPRVFALHPQVKFARVLSNVHNPFVDVAYRDVAWRCIHSVLPVNAYLYRLNIPVVSQNCTFGCAVPESVNHLFFECPFSKKLYSIIVPWIDTLSVHTIPYVRGTIASDFFLYLILSLFLINVSGMLLCTLFLWPNM
jgi:hypothetical protein